MGARSPIVGEERSPSRRRDGAASPEGIERLGEQFRVLQDVSRAYGATRDRGEAEMATARWIRTALDDEKAGVRIILPEAGGRLAVRFSDGEGRGSAGDPNELWRRAYEGRSMVREDVRSAPDQEVVAIPLVSRGKAVGVLEVVTTAEGISAREPVLTAVASQAAILFGNLEQWAQLHRELDVSRGLADLARHLLTLDSGEAVIHAVARFCADQLFIPAAVWMGQEGESTMTLAEVHADGGGVEAIQEELGSIGLWAEMSERERTRVMRRFARAVGHAAASPIAAGNAVVILVASDDDSILQGLRELLRETLGYIGYIDRARRRDEELDVALAWTAHELRGPLATVRAHLENLLYEEEPGDRALLTRLLAEIDGLSSMVEPMLEYSSGGGSLDLQPTDLPSLVRDAVGSLPPDLSADRVRVTGTARLIAAVDGGQLGMAVSNVIRNALVYSPEGSPVEVEIDGSERDATVRIMDRGPGVEPAEWDSIFDPFVRGRAGAAHAGGKGLGLYIARRVIDAHSGRIWIEPAERGAVFTIKIPIHRSERSPGPWMGDEQRAEGEPARPSA
jgi:signal transduction histidine kinase